MVPNGGSVGASILMHARFPGVRPLLTASDLDALSARTLAHYEASAHSFLEGTRDHDVSQNYAAFLGAIGGPPPLVLLDFGCGPGRDLAYFRSLGHEAVGLDGSASFVQMARAATGCEVMQQDFLRLSLPAGRFHGAFANASLFHVPAQELPRVLRALRDALVEGGVLFCSNPHGRDTEGFAGERYGAFHTLETWRAHVTLAGFCEIDHYYRPAGKPRSEQPWLASVWRKKPAPHPSRGSDLPPR
jgi:SAM-dependent methyltransferase